jgi:hypothetical protein
LSARDDPWFDWFRKDSGTTVGIFSLPADLVRLMRQTAAAAGNLTKALKLTIGPAKLNKVDG